MKVYVVISECHDSGFDFGIEIKEIFSKREDADKFCDKLNHETLMYLESCVENYEQAGITEDYSVKEFEVVE